MPKSSPLLARLTRPVPLSWIATTAAVLCLGARDSLGAGAGPALFVLGGTALVATALWLVELLWGQLPTRSTRWLRPERLATLALSVGPALYFATVAQAAALRAPLVWMSLSALLISAATAWALHWLIRRAGAANDPRAGLSLLLAALELLGMFVWVHGEEGTFAQMGAGTELLHGLLFFGTWLASSALLVPWSMRVHSRVAALPATRPRAIMCALTGLVGLAAIEVDQRALVDLYPAVHVWLELIALWAVDAALAPMLSALSCTRASGERRQRVLGAVSAGAGTVLLALLIGFGVLLGRPEVREGAFRAAVLDTALGPALITFAPKPIRRYRQHPLLRYEQFLDAPAPQNAWNIVLVSSDALRGDALDAPGKRPAARSPRITAFAAERCAYFEQVYAPGSRTAIGMGGLMLGRYSAYIDWEFVIWKNHALHHPDRLTPDELAALGKKFGYTTLPRIPKHGNLAMRLKGAGLRTLAVPWDSFAAFFDEGQGFDAGFDVYADLRKQRWRGPSSSKVVEYALKQLDRKARKDKKYRRFFQWIHLFDTHSTKGDPELYRTRVLDTDRAIGELLDGLAARKLLDQTVFVLVADHGEAFGEHRASEHGSNLYEEQVRVPMVLCIPGVRPQVLAEPASTLDAVATLLALAHADMAQIDGVNMLPKLIEGQALPKRPVFTELHRYRSNQIKRTRDLRAVRIGNWKLIKDLLNGSAKLYDLGADPGELHNRLSDRPKQASELEAVLDAFIAEGERTHPLVALEPGRRKKTSAPQPSPAH